ncbi:MAG: tRNA (adenosine(37)-N6)-threonylcarbamoyltransferase complex ATPase subunit type 1 TsaE [Spirochaetaceae bacterium]|nr:tRNA (adenosine(37)-N6)-threonylcarbamoyltransferase complex ATPase subunit type 1 TsaE [Spirochaetaceae bacterium]
MNDHIVITRTPEETKALGERAGKNAHAGAIIALSGGLGAGKTCFTQGIARALGINEPVTSPTYAIVSEYKGRLPLYHIDAYRLSGEKDFIDIGGEDFLDSDGICVIEWAEKIGRILPPGALYITIELQPDGSRHFLYRKI